VLSNSEQDLITAVVVVVVALVADAAVATLA